MTSGRGRPAVSAAECDGTRSARSRAGLFAPALGFCLAAIPALARADVPEVAVDIAPLHSLVAQVMGDLGAPELVLPPGVSPHGYALRPSEARALQGADLVVWVGPALTPALEGPVETLAGDARLVEAMAVDGVRLFEMRDSAVFPAHGHDGDEEHHDEDHAHEADHDHDHEHDEVHAHGDENHVHEGEEEHDHAHDEGHEADHGHDHGHDHADGAADPHLWLDPANARAILTAVADALSELDPANAAAYAANAEAARSALADLETELAGVLAPVADRPFVVFHDAYRYFEEAFGLNAAGAISMSDARMPSAARLRDLRDRVAELGAGCVAAEPQFDPGLVEAVASGSDMRAAVLDPIGVDLEPGPDLYASMLRGLAGALAACTSES